MNLIKTTSNNSHFQTLVKLLDQELYKRYPEVQASYDEHNQFEEAIDVLVILVDEQPIACGAFKIMPEQQWVELKRIFVHPDYRRQGWSKIILQNLEEWSLKKGFSTLVLETGDRMFEAINLYKYNDYKVIPNYGPYVNMPHSICMQKKLKSNPTLLT